MAAYMTTESCVKIETHIGNRSKIYFVKSSKMYYSRILNNRKNDVLCGDMFTVENGQSNELITLVNVKSKVK